MFYRSYTPVPRLGGFIDRFWLCSDAPRHQRERILPSGTIELVVNLRDDEIRIYDPAHPDRCTRFSGAVAGPAQPRPTSWVGQFFPIPAPLPVGQ